MANQGVVFPPNNHSKPTLNCRNHIPMIDAYTMTHVRARLRVVSYRITFRLTTKEGVIPINTIYVKNILSKNDITRKFTADQLQIYFHLFLCVYFESVS